MYRSRIRSATLITSTATTMVLSAVLSAPSANAAVVSVPQAPLDSAAASALSTNVDTSVIVMMRNQPASVAESSAAATSRAKVIDNDQAPVLKELGQVRAQRVRVFHVINAVAATVSKGEAARLAVNPGVAAVIPDSVVHAPDVDTPVTAAAGTKAGPAGPATVPAGTCAASGGTQLEPEALADTHTDSDDPTAKTARTLGLTGNGVKVAYIAEGVDINNPDFIRADGSHVFADYQDFTGEGTNAPTTGAEAFIDASAIAAQGRQTYNVQSFGSPALPSPCDIRIEGMAPGASLYGFKIFGKNNLSTVSNSLQAIDYAVNVDHVNILSESVVWQPYPSITSMNPIEMANDAAVKAGVTVVAGAGDAGTQNTEAIPASDPLVISTGASTTFRWNEQTNYSAARQFSTGWIDDNVSALSSAGFNQAGRTIDLLAPGDGSFALCTPDIKQYSQCVNFLGQASNVERSGGTSQSAPLTAGTAALVMQAYRQTHGGTTPSPALVKQIITSTADDLTVPGQEQGAGLLDSYRAVQAALSVHDTNGAPAQTGSSLLVSQSQLDATGAPGSTQSWTESITNTSASTQTVDLSGRTFGGEGNEQNGTVTLNDSTSPHFSDWAGLNNNYGTVSFTVPAGAARLDASIAYHAASGGGSVRLI